MDEMKPEEVLMTIPVDEALGWTKKDDKVLIGFRQPNSLQVALEISADNLWSIIGEMIGARRAFGTPDEVGFSGERAFPISKIDRGITLGHPDRVFLRLVTPTGGYLGIEIPRDVAAKLATALAQ